MGPYGSSQGDYSDTWLALRLITGFSFGLTGEEENLAEEPGLEPGLFGSESSGLPISRLLISLPVYQVFTGVTPPYYLLFTWAVIPATEGKSACPRLPGLESNQHR